MFRNLFILLFLCTSSAAFGADLNCTIDKELSKENFMKLKQFREPAAKVCLKCEGKDCEMKVWSKDQAGDAAICKLLFCTAKKVSRGFKLPDGIEKGRSKVSFDYFISENGKIKGIDVTSASGKMNKRQAYKYLVSFSKRTFFEPLVIDGINYRISNLSGEVTASIGKPKDMDKYNAADSKLWTN